MSTTHRKTLARRFAAASGRTYAQALEIVRRAADAGRLPEPLDKDGIEKALAALLVVEPAGPSDGAVPHPVDLALAAARTRPDRKVVDDPRRQWLWDASWAFEALTGKQGLVHIEAPGEGSDRYRFGDDGINGGYTALGVADAERHMHARIEALRQRTDLCFDADRVAEKPTGPEVKTIRRSDIVACPITSLSPSHYRPDGSCLCVPEPEKPSSSSSSSEPDLFGSPSADLSRYLLVECAPADPARMVVLARTLAQAPLVQTWWYLDGKEAGVRHMVRKPVPVLTADTGLVLRDRDGVESEESFDWFDEPEKAARHRLHPDGLGITFFTPQGEVSRTHRALTPPPGTDPASLLTVMPNVPGASDGAPFDDSEQAVLWARVRSLTERACRRMSLDVTEWGADVDDVVLAVIDDLTKDSHFETMGSEARFRLMRSRVDNRLLALTQPFFNLERAAYKRPPTVPRCAASSWRDKPASGRGEEYGPGGYNRCVKAEGHHPDSGGEDPHHLDEWGTLFRLWGENKPAQGPRATGRPTNRFKQIDQVDRETVEDVARQQGTWFTVFGPKATPRPPAVGEVYVETHDGAEVLVRVTDVSSGSEGESEVTAAVVYPVPPVPTIRTYPLKRAMKWKKPTAPQMERYRRAWGIGA